MRNLLGQRWDTHAMRPSHPVDVVSACELPQPQHAIYPDT